MIKFFEQKKIKSYIVMIILYVTFCMTNWYAMRGGVAITMLSLPFDINPIIFGNDIVAFLFSGLIPLLLYEIVTSFIFRFAQVRLGGGAGGRVDTMRYALRYFYLSANIVGFLAKLFYFMTPVVSVYGNIFIDFVVTSIFMVAFLVMVCKKMVEKERIGAALYILGGSYLIVQTIIAVFALIMEVLF